MTPEARTISGITLITVPSIQYGGYFLVKSLMNRNSRYMDNPLRQNFFRAGHAHAGVFVILSLVCQILADAATLPPWLIWWRGWGSGRGDFSTFGVLSVSAVAGRVGSQSRCLAHLLKGLCFSQFRC